MAGAAKRGFTTVELVLVLVIAGILAGLAVPVVSRISALRSDAAISSLAGHIRYVQTQAMATRRRTWLVFDATADSYAGYIEDPATPGKENRIALTDPLTRSALAVTMDAGVFAGIDLSAANINGGAELVFDSRGRPKDASEAALTSNGTITFSTGMAIAIAAETGHLAITP